MPKDGKRKERWVCGDRYLLPVGHRGRVVGTHGLHDTPKPVFCIKCQNSGSGSVCLPAGRARNGARISSWTTAQVSENLMSMRALFLLCVVLLAGILIGRATVKPASAERV
jgi:hypothetical protein